MADIFLRPKLAANMAEQLLRPSALDTGLRSGLFISGLRRTGKTTFLRNDLIPALEHHGAIVIYVDLWSDTQVNPAKLVHAAVRKTLEDLQSPASAVIQQLKRVAGLDIGAMGFKFSFKLDSVGIEGGPTLAEALTAVVDQAKTNVVLIVDEVQHAIATEEGNQLLLALKATRDAINPRPNTAGHFLFIGTGSHRAMVSELTARRNQAFAGATSVDYPVLGQDYIEHLLALIDKDDAALPSIEVTTRAFNTLGNRPEEMIRALRQLLHETKSGANPDDLLPVIANTLRSTAADHELRKVEELGGVAQAVFARIASSDDRDARGIYSSEAVVEYSKRVGREVRGDELQPAVNALLDANLVMRKGHGVYVVTDPFVQEIWHERETLRLFS